MTIRTANTLLTVNYVAGQAAKAISSEDHRDFVESVDSWIAPAYVTLTSSSGTTTWATGGEKVNNADITMTEDTTLSITGAVEGATGWLEVTQDSTGGWDLTLPSGVTVGATTAINTTASKRTAVLWTYNGSAFWFILAQEA